MTAPQNAVQVQGVGSVNADQLNTYVQWCPSVAILRTFVGLTDMTVYLLGSVNPGDGGQGTFYWNPTAAGPDDGVNTIVPNGVTIGAWVREPGASVPAVFVTSGTQVAVSGTRYIALGAFTLQLPQSSLQTAAFQVPYFAYGGAITVSLANAGDKINGGAAGASVVIPIGLGGMVNTDAAGNYYLTLVPNALGLGTIASAATTDVGAVSAPVMTVSGTASISSFGTSLIAGQSKTLIFLGAATIVSGANVVTQNNANITTAANAIAIIIGQGAGVVSVLYYPASSTNSTPTSPAQGRLTLTTSTPVMVADVATATTIYYTPYLGLLFPLFAGANTGMVSIGTERSLALDSNAGHTGYQQSGNNFDLFLINNAGVIQLVSGPAWTNGTTRATLLEYKNGFLCNAASMVAKFDTSASTVTVGRDQGTYVGTFQATANGQASWIAHPAPAAGGGNCQLYLWNMYNRVTVGAVSRDSTDSWTYTTATWRAANNNNSNRISVLFGTNEENISAVYSIASASSSGAAVHINGIGLDSTSAIASGCLTGQAPTGAGPAPAASAAAFLNSPLGLGLHYIQALEYSSATGTTTWYGDNGDATTFQMGLQLTTRM